MKELQDGLLLRANRDLGYLHPILRERAQNAFLALTDDVPGICAFETWRSPARQDFLYKQGRTAAGKRVTNAKAWQSWHQYGLAFDVAVFLIEAYPPGPRWSWDFPVERVQAEMIRNGLELGPKFESAHFQLTAGLTIAEANQIQRETGTGGVWSLVSARLTKA